MTERMIERVARAIFEAWAKEEGSDATWEELLRMVKLGGYANAKKWHQMAHAEAIAAVRAMREPTDEMVQAGRASAYQAPAAAYRAMIDSILDTEDAT